MLPVSRLSAPYRMNVCVCVCLCEEPVRKDFLTVPRLNKQTGVVKEYHLRDRHVYLPPRKMADRLY